ncbi:MAG TPA: hypothetical protein VGJ60_07190 [Chloroflexota bacterium]|jgi:hypothetical protein
MTELDMQRIAELVAQAGFTAYVEHTGGGVMTIYAYREPGVSLPCRTQPDVEAGPGSLVEGRSTGFRGDFYVGRSGDDAARQEWGQDEYRTDLVTVTDETLEQVAELIVRQLRQAFEEWGPRREPPLCLRYRPARSAQCQNLAVWDLAADDGSDGTVARVSSVCNDHLAERVREWYDGAIVSDETAVQVRPWDPDLREPAD